MWRNPYECVRSERVTRSTCHDYLTRKDVSTYTALTPKIALDTMNPPLHSLSGKRLDAAPVRRDELEPRRRCAYPRLEPDSWWANRGYGEALPESRSGRLGAPMRSINEEGAVRMPHAAK